MKLVVAEKPSVAQSILQTLYKKADIHVDGSMVYFCCEK